METLDTEEATYIWHLEKSFAILKSKLDLINKDLNTVKNKGRQVFLESQPENFSRIIHDYSDDRKGLFNGETHWKKGYIKLKMFCLKKLCYVLQTIATLIQVRVVMTMFGCRYSCSNYLRMFSFKTSTSVYTKVTGFCS